MKQIWPRVLLQLMCYEYVGYLRYSAKPELEQSFGEYQRTWVFKKKIIQLVRGQLIRIRGNQLEKKGGQESEGHEGKSLVQPANPRVYGPISAKGTQEVGHEGEALVQPSTNPESIPGPFSANGTQKLVRGGSGSTHQSRVYRTSVLKAPRIRSWRWSSVQSANPEYTGSNQC